MMVNNPAMLLGLKLFKGFTGSDFFPIDQTLTKASLNPSRFSSVYCISALNDFLIRGEVKKFTLLGAYTSRYDTARLIY
jgi:hypothetical protein